MGVECPCSPVRNDIVTPRHLFNKWIRTDGRCNFRGVEFRALLRKVSLFLQMKEKLPSIYVIKHEVKFIIRL